MSQDWEMIAAGNEELLRYHKYYPDGPDVIISIVSMGNNEFEVRSSAESRTSGPNDNVIGKYLNQEEAQAAAKNACEQWDDDMESFDSPSPKKWILIPDPTQNKNK